MIRLVAFDWNGTLLDDGKLAAAGDHYVLQPYIKKKITLQFLQRHFTIPIVDYMTAVGLDKNRYSHLYTAIGQDFDNYYEARVHTCKLRTGTKACLRKLPSQNVFAIIYSNHVTSAITTQLKRFGVAQYFRAILARPNGDNSHMHQRGKVQKLLNYIKLHKLAPREVLSVGDTEEEIEIGKSHGFRTVAVSGGYNTIVRLKKHKPDFLINDMRKINLIIKKLNG